MKRWIRFLIWLAGLALFLALTAHFTLRHALNTPKFKAAATGFIQRATGRPADFERIDYTLFPFSLVVRNAALREPDGSRDFASLKELAVYVDFRTKEITSIQLAEPTVRIVQHPDGTFNFSDLLAPPAPPPPPASTAPPFALRQLQIDKACFEFITPAPDGGEQTFRISNLDFLLQDLAPGRPVHMTGKAAIGQRSSMDLTISASPPPPPIPPAPSQPGSSTSSPGSTSAISPTSRPSCRRNPSPSKAYRRPCASTARWRTASPRPSRSKPPARRKPIPSKSRPTCGRSCRCPLP